MKRIFITCFLIGFTANVFPEATDQLKKELIDRFLPTIVMHSSDVTNTGLAVEPEPVEIAINNSDYVIKVMQLDGATSINANHGKNAYQFASHLPPRSRLYWHTRITASVDCLYDATPPSCSDPMTYITDYVSNPCFYGFCGSASGLSGMPYVHCFDWPGTNANEWKSTYDTYGPNYSPTVYSTVFEDPDYYIIQYFYFYPFNDFFNDHEGDFENVNLYISKSNINRISSIDYMFHHNYIHLENNDANKNKMDIISNHPILYIGGYAKIAPMEGSGSHGIYPYPGNYFQYGILLCAPQIGYCTYKEFYNESVDGCGKIIPFNKFQVKYVLNNTGADHFYKNAFWGISSDIGWIGALWAPTAAKNFPPPSRPGSVRWKKTASQSDEDEAYTQGLPSRANSNALIKLRINIIPILNLLLD